MGDDKGRGIWLPIVCALFLTLGWYIGDGLMEYKMHKEAIEYGYAEYDKTTGEWQWMPKPLEVTDVKIIRGIYNDDGTTTKVEVE